MQLRWDQVFEDTWSGHAAVPGSGTDRDWAPAGPGGVSLVRGSGATVALCSATGRVTSVWFGPARDEGDDELLDQVIADEPRPDHHAASGREVAVRVMPAEHRALIVRYADLEHTFRHTPAGRTRLAAALLATERAIVTRLVAEVAPHWISPATRDESVAAATAAIDAVGPRTAVAPGVDVSRLRVAAATLVADASGDGELAPLAAWLRGLIEGQVDIEVRALGADDVGRTMGARSSHAPSRPVLSVVSADDIDPKPVSIEIDWSATCDPEYGTLDLGESAARWGLQRKAELRVRDRWLSLRTTADDSRRTGGYPWMTALASDGAVVGGGLIGTTDDGVEAEIAVTARPAAVELGPHPFDRAAVAVDHKGYAAADLIARLARFAALAGHRELATHCYAEAALSWIDLGQMFRAAWARERAGSATLDRQLDAIDRAFRPILDAVELTGDIPPVDWEHALVPAWVWADDLEGVVADIEG